MHLPNVNVSIGTNANNIQEEAFSFSTVKITIGRKVARFEI